MLGDVGRTCRNAGPYPIYPTEVLIGYHRFGFEAGNVPLQPLRTLFRMQRPKSSVFSPVESKTHYTLVAPAAVGTELRRLTENVPRANVEPASIC